VIKAFYGINLLACREAKPGRVIPRRGCAVQSGKWECSNT
jgi:hypothetical protein